MWTVYKHTILNNDKVYFGITSQDVKKRWLNGNGYHHNKHFTSAIKKYGWDNIKHEILMNDLSKEEAETLEQILITEYKSNNREFGYNQDNGGNTIGKHSDETKEKIRNSHIGMKYDESFCKKMSEIKRGNKNRLGKHHDEKTKLKISLSNKGKSSGVKNYFYNKHFVGKDNGKSIAVSKYDLDGNFIEMKESANQFAVELNVINATHIIECCKGKRNTAYGFKWSYLEEQK